jgi:aryl-alcohol dehydrogenase-like predicted oxidoreductase
LSISSKTSPPAGAVRPQIALAWLLAQKPWIVPIPGGTRIEHLDDNLPAAELVLTPRDLDEIEAAFATIEIEGAALSPALDAAIDRRPERKTNETSHTG